MDSAREIRFVPQQPGSSAKRKAFSTACETCRRKKKRCVHDGLAPSRRSWDGYSSSTSQLPSTPMAEIDKRQDSDLLRLQPDTSRHDRPSPSQTPDHRPEEMQGEVPSGKTGSSSNIPVGDVPNAKFSIPKRFVGDLNPEALFLNRDPSRSPREIGIWLERGDWDTVLQEKEQKRDPFGPGPIRTEFTNNGNGEVSRCALDHNVCTCTERNPDVLTGVDWDPLLNIYFSRINLLLPIVDEIRFRDGLQVSTQPDALAQAVLLVVSRDALAKPHLPGASSAMAPREFSKALYASILKRIRDGTQYDKVTLIRILALLSLHSDGPDGAEEASLHLAQAIHHAQTIGLHLNRGGHSKNDKSRNKLFWCLWSLDKLNAAINGRPVMINDNDVSIEPYSNSQGDVGFKIFLKLATMLRDVIALYRPSAPDSVTGWEDGFPGFEDIIEQYEGWSLSSSSLVTLHLFYLSVAILSSRSRSTNSTSCSTPSSVRQSLSATYVTTLICGTQPPDLPDILPLPLVPYGISLALAVAYRKLRQSRLSHMKRQAELEFERCYYALERLQHTWWSADIMATLARTVLREIYKSSAMSNPVSQSHQSLDTTGNRLEPSLPTPSSTVQVPPSMPVGDNNSEGRNQATIASDDQQTNGSDALRQVGFGMQDPFDDIDHIFGTYLDPNFPMNYDDFFKVDDLEQFGMSA